MRVRIDKRELDTEIAEDRKRAKVLHRELWAGLRKVSFACERRIKDAMPVDTGRARASWGHWTSSDTNNPEAKPGDAHWDEKERDLMTEQGSNLEYIEALNAGHSKQAPAGFIDRAEEQAVRVLDQVIDEIVEAFL